MSRGERVHVGGRTLGLSNLDKPLYPSGFTKGQVIDYYARVAPVMLPHVADRPVTFKRYPNGTSDKHFFEKRCPGHKPDWVPLTEMPGSEGPVRHCLLNEPAALVWSANLAALELHVQMARAEDVTRPTAMVFDLDPGSPAGLRESLQAAFAVRDLLAELGLISFLKTSGGKGLHLYVPINSPCTYVDTKSFSKAVGTILAEREPARYTTVMKKAEREGKVFIDWSQNDLHKTTVCVYSLRARERPTVSMPVSWERAGAARDGALSLDALGADAEEALRRIEAEGDLFAPVLTLRQSLPRL